jgi:hypothetical protein
VKIALIVSIGIKMGKKKELGQFMTTNYRHVLAGLSVPEVTEEIIEPFCGDGHLIEFLGTSLDNLTKPIPTLPLLRSIECYDIDPHNTSVIRRDTIMNPPDYSNKFVITNPPFLARNKSKQKNAFDKYSTNDLFKCFLKELISPCNHCRAGIIILPLNFWTSIRKSDIDLRKNFLEVYFVTRINIFEERVFDDTSYAICSFQFQLNSTKALTKPIDVFIFPSEKTFVVSLTSDNNYLFGGEIYQLPVSDRYEISRLVGNKFPEGTTNILVKCLDDNETNRISLSIVEDEKRISDTTPKKSARTYATLVIPKIGLDIQRYVVEKFNSFLDDYRNRFHSLFLTNYRESALDGTARKRISFDLVYRIVGHILLDKVKEVPIERKTLKSILDRYTVDELENMRKYIMEVLINR